MDACSRLASEATTQERRLRGGGACSVIVEVCEDVIAAVGDDGAMAAVGMNPCTDLDANLALRLAPLHRDILALAVRRELPVTNTAVVAARPR